MPSEPINPIWGQVFLLLTTIVGFTIAFIREGRQRQWLLQDREQAAKERADLAKKVEDDARKVTENLEAHRLELIAQVRHTGANVANTVTLSKDVLEALLQANTDVSKLAFNEANNMNQKIADLMAHSLLIAKTEKKPDEPKAVIDQPKAA